MMDGLIDDPRACQFEPATLRCGAAAGADRLTDAQLEVVRKLDTGPVDAVAPAAVDGGAATARPANRGGAPNVAARPGGGRGPSLARGLPELGRHAAILGAAIAAFAVGRCRARRARHVAARPV